MKKFPARRGAVRSEPKGALARIRGWKPKGWLMVAVWMGGSVVGAWGAPAVVLEVKTLTRDLAVRLGAPVSPGPRAGWLSETRGEAGGSRVTTEVQWTSAIGADGEAVGGRQDVLFRLPGGGSGLGSRRFEMGGVGGEVEPTADRRLRFTAMDERSLELREGDRPVFVYRHGTMLKPGVPADRARSSYLHPVYGMDGEVLTDDFPEDHHHHRGLFWSWPHVGVGGKQYDLWALKGVAHRFERWLAREEGSVAAVMGVENGWYVGETRVVRERIWVTTFAASGDERVIDLDCTWIPEGQAVTLAGAEGKSYGGMTIRYAPGTNTVITTPRGNGGEDLYMTPLAWADLSRRFEGRTVGSGAALLVAPDHPDYPPTWLTRHYGVLCLGWPGVKARTFAPGEPIRCRYRVWIHRGVPTPGQMGEVYEAYTEGLRARWLGVEVPR